jgi:hypothetical protein
VIEATEVEPVVLSRRTVPLGIETASPGCGTTPVLQSPATLHFAFAPFQIGFAMMLPLPGSARAISFHFLIVAKIA